MSGAVGFQPCFEPETDEGRGRLARRVGVGLSFVTEAKSCIAGDVMSLETLEALSRVVILAWSYVQEMPQSGEANREAIAKVLSWLQQNEEMPAGWEKSEAVSAALELLN